MKMRHPSLFAPTAALLLLLGCSADPDCDAACENLASCEMLEGSRGDCVRNCKEDPTVLSGDVECLSTSSCAQMSACIQSTVSPVTCWEVCTRIYDGCNAELQMKGGALDKEECMALCRAEFTDRKVNCLNRMGCGRVGECL